MAAGTAHGGPDGSGRMAPVRVPEGGARWGGRALPGQESPSGLTSLRGGGRAAAAGGGGTGFPVGGGEDRAVPVAPAEPCPGGCC